MKKPFCKKKKQNGFCCLKIEVQGKKLTIREVDKFKRRNYVQKKNC
jgi:hypothetical protein